VKILDKYLLKSFLITFTTVFVILFFIFVLQVVWLFISELAGKDLDFLMILKFLLFKMPSIIPLVLPLSVLLASIMTFGSLAENYEFAAMKSSGISLQRAMRSLIYFIAILSVVAFLFANNVIPFAEYKFVNFRRNIAQVKPALAIAEGQFSQIGSYNIKVDKKSGDNGKYLKGVTIHKLANIGSGSNTVIKAKTGELVSSESSNILKLILKDGNYYEDIIPKKFEERNKVPFAKSEFKKYVINIDLSKLNSDNMDEAQITNTNTMLTIGELRFTLDSLQKNYKKDIISIAENITQRTSLTPSYSSSTNGVDKLNNTDILHKYADADKTQILSVANSNVDATNFSLSSSSYEIEDKQKNISQHWIAFYEKFVIAFSCLLMFFIGAPLGAIIRKGGLGMPIVFAILIFIIFHFINTFGKKVAQQNEIAPLLGSWMSTIVLLPLAILLTKKATDDKGFNISFDWFTNFFNRFNPIKNETLVVATVPSIDTFDVNKDKETTNYKASVPQSKPVSKNETQQLTLVAFESYFKQYRQYSLFSLLGYFTLLLVLFLADIHNIIIVVSIVIIGVGFYVTLYKTQSVLQKIGTQTNNLVDLKTFIVLLGAFPFYPLFYIYNRIYLKEVQSNYHTQT
jgi:lipopolysaccharide export system permease protein